MDDAVWSKAIPLGVLILVGLIEAAGGLYLHDRRTRNDWTLELVSLAVLPTLVQPGIFAIVLLLSGWWATGA